MAESNNISSDIHNFLNEIVEGRIGDYKIDFEGNSELGGNYLGDILFISLTDKKTNEAIHLVVKQAFPNLKDNPMFKGVYQNEIHFYKTTWKTFEDFQKAHNVEFDKIAKYLGCDPTEGTEKIALDNLKYKGFVLHDKTKPLSKNHIEIIMKSYGIFHAISFAYRELHPEEYAKLVEPCKKVTFATVKVAFASEFKKLVESFENDINDSIFEIIKTYESEAGNLFVDSLNYVGDTPVLVHGDCWSNNMMFKFDDRGNIEDIKFLDFQYAKSGSPVHDLSYALYSGVTKDILNKLDFYLKIYHDSFSNTLKKFGYDAQKLYSFEKLKDEWKQYCKFGFLMSLFVWRMKFTDKKDIPNLKEKSNDQAADEKPPKYLDVAEAKADVHKQIVKDLITHMYDNGFL